MNIRYRVEITATAENDIQEIWRFLIQENPPAAALLIDSIEQEIDTLESFPMRCALAKDAAPLHPNIRQLFVQRYRVLFRIIGKRVIILRITHTARLIDSINT